MIEYFILICEMVLGVTYVAVGVFEIRRRKE
jgi:hypothetical protein